MKTLLRLALATLATFLLTEIGLRAYRAAVGQAPPHPDPSLAAEWNWAKDHLALGHATLESDVRHDPALGWRVPDIARPAAGGPEKVRKKRTPGVPRVVLVGDSFTRELRGLGRQSGQYAFQRRWEVVNLAVQGFGSGQAWLRYRTTGRDYRPDVAVFGLYVRDYFRTFRSFRGYAKPTFALGAGGEVVVGNVPVIAPEALYEAYRSGERRIGRPRRSFVLDFIAERRALYERRDSLRDEQFAVFTAILRTFRDDALADGACPLLLIFPTRPDEYEGSVYQEIDLRTRAFAGSIGLPYVALAEALYSGATLEEQERLFGEGRGAHLSRYGRTRAIHALHRTFDERFDEAAPGCAPETTP
jgi:hypothetical protein